MNKLKITLNEDGSIIQFTPDFKIMRGSYRNVLINIEVPHSLLIDPVVDTDYSSNQTGNNVRIGAIIRTATGQNLQTQRYEFQRVKDYTYNGIGYRLYQRKMPKEFTMWETVNQLEATNSGVLEMVINVTNWTLDGNNAKIEEVAASPVFTLDIYPSAFLENAEEIDEPSDFDELYSQVQNIDAEVDEVNEDLYGTDGLGEFLTSRLKEGYKILLEKEGKQIKISVDTIKASEVPIDAVVDMEAKDVQTAIEELSKRTDKQHVDTVTGEDEYLVDNTDTYNPIIKHDKDKIDKVSIADDLTTTDQNKVLSARQGVVVKQTLDAHSSRLDTLNENKAEKSEVAQQILEAVNAILDAAPETFDTLREVADWIENDEAGTAALISRVSQNETKLATIEEGANVNVQADWEQTDETADDFIRNKPNIPDGVLLYDGVGENTNGAMTQDTSTKELAKKADKTEIPTKLSQLENDADIAYKNELPTSTSELENDSDYTTNAKLEEEADKKVDKGQGTTNKNKNMGTDASGNVTPLDYVTIGGDITIKKEVDTPTGEISLVFEFPEEA